MSVQVTNPKPWGEQTSLPLPVSAGGTGYTDPLEMVKAFGLEPINLVGNSSHAIPLNDRAEIDPKYLGGVVNLQARISGDTFIQVGETKEYFLTTFDCFTDYDVKPIGGAVSRDGAIITYTAGDIAGMGGFSVNGYLCSIEIQGFAIARPTIVFPRDFYTYAEYTSSSSSVTASGYHNSGPGLHISTDWELANDDIFTSIVKRSSLDKENLTDWYLNSLKNGVYYVRVRYHGDDGSISDWSEPVSIYVDNTVIVPTIQANLLFGSPSVNHGFGYNCAMNGDGTVAVIASTNNWGDKKGKAYIYTRVGVVWSLIQTLPLPPGMAAEINYGIAVAMSGNVSGSTSSGLILIGADSEDTGGNGRGCVYVYRKSSSSNGSWYYYATIRASDAANGDGFGNAVAINHDASRAIVGALTDDGKGSNAGCMYYFTIENEITWDQVNVFYAQDSQAGQTFGTSASINEDGTLCVVGANRDTVNGTNSGSAYVFELVNEVWKQVTKIIPTDGKAEDYFGNTVAMSGDASILNGNLILIAAPSSDDFAVSYPAMINTGKVYVYGRVNPGINQWKLLYTYFPILAPNVNNVNFGIGLAIDETGNNILIGMPGIDIAATNDNYGQVDYFSL